MNPPCEECKRNFMLAGVGALVLGAVVGFAIGKLVLQ